MIQITYQDFPTKTGINPSKDIFPKLLGSDKVLSVETVGLSTARVWIISDR